MSELERLEQRNEVADLLRRARALVDAPEKWMKHPRGDRLCAGLAITFASDGDLNTELRAYHALREVAPFPNGGIAQWNDAPERTHAEVLQAFDRAIAQAKLANRPSPANTSAEAVREACAVALDELSRDCPAEHSYAIAVAAQHIRDLDLPAPDENARDAARYRYLRDSHAATNEPFICIYRAAYSHFWGESADKLIDAALAQGGRDGE